MDERSHTNEWTQKYPKRKGRIRASTTTSHTFVYVSTSFHLSCIESRITLQTAIIRPRPFSKLLLAVYIGQIPKFTLLPVPRYHRNVPRIKLQHYQPFLLPSPSPSNEGHTIPPPNHKSALNCRLSRPPFRPVTWPLILLLPVFIIPVSSSSSPSSFLPSPHDFIRTSPHRTNKRPPIPPHGPSHLLLFLPPSLVLPSSTTRR